MHTLTVTGKNENGQPDTGDPVLVVNAADWRMFGDPIESENVFYHGAAKFSVPAGTYWAIGYFDSGPATRMDILPQFTVQGDTTVRLAARAASSKVAMVTPRPSAEQFFTTLIVRGGLHGTSFAVDNGGFPVTYQPDRARPTVGHATGLHARVAGVARRGVRPSRIPIGWRWPGRPTHPLPALCDQPGRTGDPSTTTTTRPRQAPDMRAATRSRWARDSLRSHPKTLRAKLPGTQTEYVSAGPSVLWRAGTCRPAGSMPPASSEGRRSGPGSS